MLPLLSTHLQAQTYEHIRRGKDLIGRARTGMGKTLAFAVPVIEKLLADGAAGNKPGRRPRVLVMAPTRELAKQVRGCLCLSESPVLREYSVSHSVLCVL